MSNIIRLPRDPHQECQLLLPWYATGRLDPDERARVEAHLAACQTCRADLAVERRLEAEVAGLPLDIEQGWAAMRRRLEAGPAPARGARAVLKAGAPWLGWGMAAAFAVFAVSAEISSRPPLALYHTLSAAPPTAGNVIVMFRPDAREAAMTAAIKASGGSLADGPTPAGAYVLRVAPAAREKALQSLRASDAVVLAEPIDGTGGAP